MTKKVLGEDARQALAEVEYPAIDRTLIDLRILRDSRINDGEEG